MEAVSSWEGGVRKGADLVACRVKGTVDSHREEGRGSGKEVDDRKARAGSHRVGTSRAFQTNFNSFLD